jgi:hypothetical protein
VRPVSWTVGAVALLASGAYLFVYIYRWEWHRALLVGVLFLATLVGLCTALIVRRISRMEGRLPSDTPPTSRIVQRLRQAPVESAPFPWLKPVDPGRTHIFIPVLLGGGFVVSGLAWAIERLAGRSARSGVERQLAVELEDIAFPTAGLVPAEAELMASGADAAEDPALRMLLGPATDRALR